MPSPSIDYHANPSARLFHQSTATVKAIMGPVGSGKSLAWMMQFVKKASALPFPLRGLVVRQSWPELRDATKITWESKLGPVSDWRQNDHQMTITLAHPQTGAPLAHTMDFRHAKTAADATRFMSTEYGFICLEECVPAFDLARGTIGGGCPKEIFDAALLRLRQPGVDAPELVCAFNPPPKRHWCFREFVLPAETEAGRAMLARKRYEFFDQPPFENRHNLPPGYYERLLEILSPELADRFVYGKPITIYPGMPIYPSLLEDVHIVDRVPVLPGLGICTGHDFGRTPAILFYQVTPTGQIRFVRELQLWGASSEDAVERMAEMLKAEFPREPWQRGFGDPSGQNPTETDNRTSFTIFAAKGYPLMAGAETLAARTESIKQRAARSVGKEPAFLVSSDGCPMLSEALLGAYRYPKSADGALGFQPLKNDHSHIANACEYAVSGEFSPFTGERLREDEVRRPGRDMIPRYNPFEAPRERPGGGWMS